MTGWGTGTIRNRDRCQSGLTLVEILVTIVLSGLFFAALVPVFVMASQQGQTDRARVLATNAAQSAIEVLRDVPYDDLYDTDWSVSANVATVADLQWKGTGSGFNIGVTPYPVDSAKGQERYILVTARAWWVRPGGRVSDVTLRTAVYRQGLGTHTLLLYAYPLQSGLIKAVPVTVTARMDAGDANTTDRIDFEVWANNGTAVSNWSVYTDEADGSPYARLGSDGYYYYEAPWAASGVADGTYTFIAKTVPRDPSDPDYDGDWVRKQYVLDLVQPGLPTIESCTPGFQPDSPDPGALLTATVGLSWTLEVNISDVGHIEILRTELTPTGPLSPTTLLVPSKSAQTYVDRGLQPGSTYSYKVLVEDAQGGRGDWSEPLECTIPESPLGTAPKPPASWYSTSISGRSVTLRWTASPSRQVVDEYRVYRDPGLTVYFPGRLPSEFAPLVGVFAGRSSNPPEYYEYTDPTVEYGGTYSYLVTAVTYDDVANVMWESVSLSSGLVQIPQPAVLSMRINLAVDSSVTGTRPTYARVVIHSLDTGLMIPANPWEYPTLKFVGSQREWDTAAKNPFKADLYEGSYEVIAMFYAQTGQRLGTYIQPVELLTLATPVTVTYRGPN